MTDLIACDVSAYQVPVDDSYPHRWLIFRDTDPAYAESSPDKNAAANAAWCRAAKAAGRIDGWTTYAVYEPGCNDRIMQYLAALGELDYVMIDVESWGGAITGDHSAEINALANLLAAKYGQDKIWGYANRNDIATEWPNRVPWLPIVVASYGGSEPDYPNKIGWQYTDGQYTVPGLPNSSPPFGPCDHNLLHPNITTTPPAQPEDDMTMLLAHDKWGTGFWLGNGITRRHIGQTNTDTTYADALHVLGAAGVTVKDLGVVADLAAIGEPQLDTDIAKSLATLTAQSAALETALKQVQAGAPVDLAAITAAAKAGADQALATIQITVSTPANGGTT